MVRIIRVYRTSVVLCALPCLAAGLLVACGDTKTLPTPSVGFVDLAVAGQTVIKVRTAGSHVRVA